jgi:hypothetical protein
MPKTNKKRNDTNNKTKKLCPISLKPFEERFSRKLVLKSKKFEQFKKKGICQRIVV